MAPLIEVSEEGIINMNLLVPGIYYNLTLIRPQITKENVEKEITSIEKKLARCGTHTAVVVTKDYEAGNVRVPIRKYSPEVPNSQKRCRTINFIPLKKWLFLQEHERFEEWAHKQRDKQEKYISDKYL